MHELGNALRSECRRSRNQHDPGLRGKQRMQVNDGQEHLFSDLVNQGYNIVRYALGRNRLHVAGKRNRRAEPDTGAGRNPA